MKFKQGNKVEVLRRTKERNGSWFPGEIISADVSWYTVRYELFMNLEGEHVVENVFHADHADVRPRPPPLERKERWAVGEIAEVFDVYCWKVGKIAKVMQNNRFVIRLFGSIQLKEFHKSCLRVRQAWRNNKWDVVEKLGKEALQQGIHKEVCPRQGEEMEQLKTSHPVKTLKRKLDSNFDSSPDDAFVRFGGSKRNSKGGKSERLHMRTPSLLEQVDAFSSPKAKVGKKTGLLEMNYETEKPNYYSRNPVCLPTRVTEDNNECSVASCSSNNFPEYTPRNFQKSSRNLADSSFNDAESFCPSISEREYLFSSAEDEMEDGVHKLELHAYRSTMQALYASGPLSWEQEALLTNLRLSLNISNEEHLLQLRQLLST